MDQAMARETDFAGATAAKSSPAAADNRHLKVPMEFFRAAAQAIERCRLRHQDENAEKST